MNVQALRQTRFVADQPPELGAEGVRQDVRERRQQHARIRIGSGEKDGAMERHNRLPRASGARDAGWAAVVPFHQLPLLGMEKHGPLVPWEIQGALELLDVGHHAEPALRVGMMRTDLSPERPARAGAASRPWPTRGVPRPPRQGVGQPETADCPHRPGARPATIPTGTPYVMRSSSDIPANSRAFTATGFGASTYVGMRDLLNRLPNLHQLGGTRLRMRLQLAPLGPVVRLVMMTHVAKQQAALALVDNERRSPLTRTDQKFLSFAFSSL